MGEQHPQDAVSPLYKHTPSHDHGGGARGEAVSYTHLDVYKRQGAVVAALGAVVPGFGGGPARSGDALVKRLRSALGRGERAVGDRGSDNNDDDTTGGSSADEPTGDGAQRLGLKKQRRSERPTASKPTEKKNDGGGSW